MANDSIVFFGSGPVASESLKSLALHFVIEAVITKPVPPHHKGIAPVEELAKQLELDTIFTANTTELDQIFEKNNFKSKVGIVVDFGIIISEKVIKSFDLGIVNSHFSLLPQWRGADPITFAILSGQPTTGVSIMIIEPTLDTGKLLVRKPLNIMLDDTTPSLTKKLVDFSNKLLAEYLPQYLSGQLTPFDQPNPETATYSRKLTKSDGSIDWSKPAIQIEREVRAYAGWPRSYVKLFNKDIIITKSHVIDNPKTPLDIKCGDNNYLSIDELIAPSGRTMSANDFINGYRLS